MLLRRPLTLTLGALALAFAGLAGAQVQAMREQNLVKTDLAPAAVVTVDRLPGVNLQLVPVGDQERGLDQSSRVDLWVVPAKFDGLWCGTGLLHEFSLRLTQQHEQVHGSLARRDRVREIEGHIVGDVLHTQSTKIGSLLLERSGNELRVTGGDGIIALARGATFHLAGTERCTG